MRHVHFYYFSMHRKFITLSCNIRIQAWALCTFHLGNLDRVFQRKLSWKFEGTACFFFSLFYRYSSTDNKHGDSCLIKIIVQIKAALKTFSFKAGSKIVFSLNKLTLKTNKWLIKTVVKCFNCEIHSYKVKVLFCWGEKKPKNCFKLNRVPLC